MRNSKILVTGATGFIGSHLTEYLVKNGFRVTAFDRYNPELNLGNLKNSKYIKHIEFIFGDIRDYDCTYKAVKGKDIVLHLAALGGIPYSYYSPLAYIKTNIEGTYNVLESCKNLNIEQLIVTSTSEVYGSAVKTPMDENHRLLGQSPYASSKIAADQLAISYWRSYNLPVKIIRPFNVYGPRQSQRAVIPSIILQALFNKSIKIGNLYTSRDYTYVHDLCVAYLSLLKATKLFGTPINVGLNFDYKIIEIVESIKKKLSSKIKIIVEKKRLRPSLSEVLRLKCDNKLILNKTNWRPSVSFDVGLNETIKWFKLNKKRNNYSNYII